jgi:hypothetical protein
VRKKYVEKRSLKGKESALIQKNGKGEVGDTGIAFLTSMTYVSARARITISDRLRVSHLGRGILDSEMSIQLLLFLCIITRQIFVSLFDGLSGPTDVCLNFHVEAMPTLKIPKTSYVGYFTEGFPSR